MENIYKMITVMAQLQIRIPLVVIEFIFDIIAYCLGSVNNSYFIIVLFGWLKTIISIRFL